MAWWHALRGRIMVQAVGRAFDVLVVTALLTLLFVDQVRTTTSNSTPNDAALVYRCSML